MIRRPNIKRKQLTKGILKCDPKYLRIFDRSVKEISDVALKENSNKSRTQEARFSKAKKKSSTATNIIMDVAEQRLRTAEMLKKSRKLSQKGKIEKAKKLREKAGWKSK